MNIITSIARIKARHIFYEVDEYVWANNKSGIVHFVNDNIISSTINLESMAYDDINNSVRAEIIRK